MIVVRRRRMKTINFGYHVTVNMRMLIAFSNGSKIVILKAGPGWEH